MDGRIVLNATEQRRIVVLNHLSSESLINAEAAKLLGVSVRQLQRLHKAYTEKERPAWRTATVAASPTTPSMLPRLRVSLSWPETSTKASITST
jgi:hypothetical protein